MPYGVRWDRKLAKWIVYRKDTDKVIGQFEDQDKARRHLEQLQAGRAAPYRKGKGR